MAARGRPSKFTSKLAAEICNRLADGRTLRDVCSSEDMPPESTVRRWALEDFGADKNGKGGFSAQYARAREIGYHAMADELLEIADDGTNDWMERNGEDQDAGFAFNGEHVQRSRLRLDTRKWMLSKALPKIYGEKVVHAGDDDAPVVHKVLTEYVNAPD